MGMVFFIEQILTKYGTDAVRAATAFVHHKFCICEFIGTVSLPLTLLSTSASAFASKTSLSPFLPQFCTLIVRARVGGRWSQGLQMRSTSI